MITGYSQIEQRDDLSVIKIQDQLFELKCFLVNPEGRFFIIRPDAIRNLQIDDVFTNFYTEGSIVLNNTGDLLERPNTTTSKPTEKVASYLFRGDSRDILRISFTPVLREKLGIEKTEKNQQLLTINHEYAVYNVEDILEEDGKNRKLYFRDLAYQIMLEKNTPFSTHDVSSTGLARTGDAIRALLQKTFPKSDGFLYQYGHFDPGVVVTDFSAPAQYKAFDSFAYLNSFHVSTESNNYDSCFLRLSRFPFKFTFTSLADIFKLAYSPGRDGTDAGGSLFLERFILGGYTDTSNRIDTVIDRSPAIAVFLSKQSTIDNFAFTPPPGEYTQSDVVSRYIHSYNTSTGTFGVDVKENSYNRAADIYRKNYVAPLKGEKNLPASNLIPNIYRSTNQNVRNEFSVSLDPKSRLGMGRNTFLKQSVLLNNAISFSVPGATYRQAGHFISIDRQDATRDSEFDDKLLGIYFLVSVKHVIGPNSYRNDIIAVKTYNYRDLKFTGKSYV